MKHYWHIIPEIVGCNAMLRVAAMQAVEAVERGQHFLVEGEAGSGCRLLARSAWSRRTPGARSLFTLDCRMFSADSAELLLFGERVARGPHTTIQMGKLSLAANGGLLLLHAETLPAKTQSRLAESLRKSMLRPRAESPQLMMTTTPSAIEASALDAELRSLLLPIQVPPLRERIEDIRPLCEAILHSLSPFARAVCSAALIERFCEYSWPGNVTELRAVLRRLTLGAHNGLLDIHHLAEQAAHDAGCYALLHGRRRPPQPMTPPGLLFGQPAAETRSLQ